MQSYREFFSLAAYDVLAHEICTLLMNINCCRYYDRVYFGLGCAPIYPSIISLTPERFGAAASQSMVSLQMACAYVGSTVMPPLVAFVVAMRGAAFVPVLLGGILAAMVLLSEAANAKLAGGQPDTSKIC